MLVSYQWLRDYVKIDVAQQEVAEALTMLGFEVEEIQDLGKRFDKFVVGEVLRREDHPDADKLSVCEVTTGEGESRTIICGAPNVDAGQKVVVALNGAVVPNGGFTIEKRKIRGVVSNGMICSVAELDFGEDADGIWVLPEEAPLGMPFASYIGAGDFVFDLSITPNRADSLSHIGIARELAARYEKKLQRPEVKIKEGGGAAADHITLDIRQSDDCPRYAGRVVKGVKVASSPDWLQNRLRAVGLRPRNNIVDITNYVLMECGHPLHAFDLNEIRGNKIIVRRAAEGAAFTTLDDKERSLDDRMLMICDGERPVAVAGVMGGQNSEIADSTTDVFIESAYFDPASVRRTARKLGISSDASYRFERGADVENVVYAVNRAAALMAEIAGGQVLEGIVDAYPRPLEQQAVRMRFARASMIAGVDIPAAEQRDYLQRLNFELVAEDADSITVRPPSYRVDIHQEIDLIEEVARMYNYDNVKPAGSSRLPLHRDAAPDELSVASLRVKLRGYLRGAGFNEIITPNQLDPASAAHFTDNPVKLANPLGEELSIMRPSLLPAFLRVIRHNQRFGTRDLRLFDIGRTFSRDDEADVFIRGIRERYELLFGICGAAESAHWDRQERQVDFYDIKGHVEAMVEALGLRKISFAALSERPVFLGVESQLIRHRKQIVGYVGNLAPDMAEAFDLESPLWLCSLDLEAFFQAPRKTGRYEAISAYPAVKRDLAFVLDTATAAAEVENVIRRQGGPTLQELGVFDVFTGAAIGEGKKSVAFSLLFNSPKRTLQDEEVDQRIAAIVGAVQKQFGGELR